MAQGLEIRRARPEELQACADLYVRVLTDTFTWLPAERHDRSEFLRSARDEEIYVAVEDGQIVGVAGFYRPMHFLHSLYVSDRGRGVGKKLLDYVSRASRGPLSLKVQEKNLRARDFYAREGFTLAERGRDLGSDITWLRLVRPPDLPN